MDKEISQAKILFCVVQGKPLPSIDCSKNLDPIISDVHVPSLHPTTTHDKHQYSVCHHNS